MIIENLTFILEVIGTAAFAVSGVQTALNKRMDIFGTLVLSLVTAVGGGILRDLILGDTPPVAFREPVFSFTALLVSAAIFTVAYFRGKKSESSFENFSRLINVIDSMGLAIFAIDGVNRAHACGFGENAYLSVFVGMLTAVGGGVIRDIMAGEIPVILKKRIYALAAFLGCLVYQIIIEHSFMSESTALIISILLIFAVRILATIFRWNLPKLGTNTDK